MNIDKLIILISILLAILGGLFFIVMLFNSSLVKVLKQTSSLFDNVDIKMLLPKNLSYRYIKMKRLFDISFSCIVILCWSPIILLISIIIKLESKGPILVTQNRIGQNGKIFKRYRFRTMMNSDKPEKNLPDSLRTKRVTKFGYFLRKTGLDEMPVFINVLKGNMTLIGRSHILDYTSWSDQLNPELRSALLKIKPGIASLWSVSYDKVISNNQVSKYDILYLNKMSFVFDLKILFRVIVVIFGKGSGV